VEVIWEVAGWEVVGWEVLRMIVGPAEGQEVAAGGVEGGEVQEVVAVGVVAWGEGGVVVAWVGEKEVV
jgi:hypothetical protein